MNNRPPLDIKNEKQTQMLTSEIQGKHILQSDSCGPKFNR